MWPTKRLGKLFLADGNFIWPLGPALGGKGGAQRSWQMQLMTGPRGGSVNGLEERTRGGVAEAHSTANDDKVYRENWFKQVPDHGQAAEEKGSPSIYWRCYVKRLQKAWQRDCSQPCHWI